MITLNPKILLLTSLIGLFIQNYWTQSQERDNILSLDTNGAIPGMTQYYDHVTNGNNLRKIIVLGDTVIVACDYTDSLNSQNATARRTYYQISYDGGDIWESSGLPVSNNYTAYPDIVPIRTGGDRTIAVSGLGSPTGAYIGVDVLLGAGSFTIYSAGPVGPYFPAVSTALLNPNVGYAFMKADTLLYRSINCQNGSYSFITIITILPPNSRYYIASNQLGTHVFVMWWNSQTHEIKGRRSTNSGNSFDTINTVCPSLVNINGDMVTPTYAADVIYKPGTTTLYAAFSTLAPGMFPTAKGSKVLLWSPAVNGGVPVKIADWRNINSGFINDTTYFSGNLKRLQTGLTPVSHPSIAFSSNGLRLVCVFSTPLRDTTSYGYHYNNVFGNYSEDGGQNWTPAYSIACIISEQLSINPGNDEIYPTVSKTGNSLNRFYVTYSLSAFPGSASFGDAGTPVGKVYQIFKVYCPTVEGSVTIISTEIPSSFLLEQNYPNPFNPNTVIKFDVMKKSFVKIIVYDITGREVKRLVDEDLGAGKYSVNFDGGNLASGIYFYSLLAGDFAETKKMILVK